MRQMAKPTKPNRPAAKRARLEGSGAPTTFEVPCIETKSNSKTLVEDPLKPPKVTVMGNCILLICGPLRLVLWPKASVIEHELNNDEAAPVI